MAIEIPHRQWVTFTAGVLQAWREVTFRQWAWATGIALALTFGYVLGALPPLLSMTPNVFGPRPPPWRAAQYTGLVISGLAAAYCFLLALSVAERDSARWRGRASRYVAAGCAATGAAVVIEGTMCLLVPSLAPRSAGWSTETRQLIGFAIYSAANFGLSGGLVLGVYARFQSARVARQAFHSAELERMEASRAVLSSRLAAMQAQVEPQFLLGTLAQVDALYDRDPGSGARMLDGLIAYLRAALPQLRSEGSTLQREAQLAESYLRIVELRMGSRLEYAVDIRPGVANCEFPPMLLLPLIDDALRNGLEPLPHGGKLALTARRDHDRLRVSVVDDGLPRLDDLNGSSTVATLHERLRGFYDDTAKLELTANTPHGVIAMIEVPLETARAHR